jgi:hypothetical protein
MPILGSGASDFTANVRASAETNAAVSAASSVAAGGPAPRKSSSGGGIRLSAGAGAVVTQSATAKSSGLQPLAARVTTVSIPVGPLAPIPTRIASLRGWFDASDATSLVLSGSQVTTWRDKSGRGNDLTGIENTTTKPVYTSSPTPYIVTANAGLEGPANSDFTSQTITFLAVMRQNDEVGGPIVTFKTDESESGWWQYGGSPNTFIWLENTISGWSPYPGVSTFPVYNTDVVVAGQWNGLNNPINIRWAGATQQTVTQTGTFVRDRLRLGFRRTDISHDARFYEVLYFNTALTIPEIQLMEGYLAWKWGAQSTLAINHLYKTSPPS